ncbi:helix-hairpin-helix domain-containing protein [Streptomyces sp. NPDC089799]|uniref:helix-hairpin-helix domain-containing protein n=1 Tax=Streptomyces sp. NPDC089799 TaxID=3155066 RepID=UPI003433179F
MSTERPTAGAAGQQGDASAEPAAGAPHEAAHTPADPAPAEAAAGDPVATPAPTEPEPADAGPGAEPDGAEPGDTGPEAEPERAGPESEGAAAPESEGEAAAEPADAGAAAPDSQPEPGEARAPGGARDGGPGAEPAGPESEGAAAPGPEAGPEAEPGRAAAPETGAEPPRGEAGAEAETATAGPATDATPGDEAEPGTETGEAGQAGAEPHAAAQQSEAEAELAAQKFERERIARRKAERTAPIDAGTGLSGTAADLLAAVRAVESGDKPASRYFDDAAPAGPRRPATPPPPRPEPAPAVARPVRAAASAEAVTAVRALLGRAGAPEALAPRAAELLGEGAADQLSADPWQLLAVPGVRPSQADGFARSLLGPDCGPGDERRAAALVGWLLAQAAVKGHTALDATVLQSALAGYGVPNPEEALEHAIGDGSVLVFQEPVGDPVPEGEEQPVRVLVGLEGAALAEESLADGLARLINTFTGAADWSDAAGSAPGRSAAELIRTAAGHGLVAHTGGEAARAEPRALFDAARGLGLRACLAAHVPAAGAVTVAGLLGGTEGPRRDADGQWELDLLVVLDAPQLDVEAAAALVESVPDGARLVLSGDPGVLGSAGAGRVFADLLAARACPQVVSRTPDPGPLGELVSGIGIGELNQVDAPGKEVVIVPVRDAGEAVHRTVQLVAESVPRAFGTGPDGVQVITPGHGGSAGTRALNAALKERLNPGPGRFGGFDPGDRVVHVPSPGRAVPAAVVSADAEGLHLDRGPAGGRTVVPKELVESQVRHGWAVTAHQAVGARWPAVVVVLPGDAADALSRDWVYTAFGRAERHLSVVHGVDQALPKAVAEVTAKPRTTRLTGLLRTLPASTAPEA